MFAKLVTLCVFVAVAQTGLVASSAHYSPGSAAPPQSFVRYDQRQSLAASVDNQAAPVDYHAPPVQYSPAAAVSSQKIGGHNQPAKQIAIVVPARVAYHTAPAAFTYHSAPAAVAYHASPIIVADHAAPLIAQYKDFNAYPKYEDKYAVADSHTGDNKSQQETRDGDVVKGSYSFQDADGSVRTFEYTADDQKDGLPASPVHYSKDSADRSQSFVRYDQRQSLAASVENQAAPVAYHAPSIQYSSAAAVSSQKIVRHKQPAKQIAISAPATVAYHTAPAALTYHSAPAAVAYRATPVIAKHKDFDSHPKYEYKYTVADSHTGDNKSQQETRDGDVVKGSYSVQEADGSVRTVEYTADDQNGFKAVVHNSAPTATPPHVKAVPLQVAPAYYYH